MVVMDKVKMMTMNPYEGGRSELFSGELYLLTSF
jgi:hypothetical protein